MTIFHFIQTLTKLNLGFNGISDAGAQYLADALRNSKVSETLFPFHPLRLFYLWEYLSFIQTLTRLDLCSNRISDIGMQYLADGLRNSKVSETLYLLHPLRLFYLWEYLSFHPDSHSTGSWFQQNLTCRCPVFG